MTETIFWADWDEILGKPCQSNIVQDVKNQSIFSMWIPIRKKKQPKYICPRGMNGSTLTEMALKELFSEILRTLYLDSFKEDML